MLAYAPTHTPVISEMLLTPDGNLQRGHVAGLQGNVKHMLPVPGSTLM
jgi:hypothetical protein